MDGVGFTPESAKRIGDAVKGWEAFQPSIGAGGLQRRDASKIIRVKLDDDISATDPVSGKMQRRKSDFSDWEDTAIEINNIYAIDSDHATAVAGDYIWVINQGNHWCEVQTGGGGSAGGGSSGGSGCGGCGGCGGFVDTQPNSSCPGVSRTSYRYSMSVPDSTSSCVSSGIGLPDLVRDSGCSYISDNISETFPGSATAVDCHWELTIGPGVGGCVLNLVCPTMTPDTIATYKNQDVFDEYVGNKLRLVTSSVSPPSVRRMLPCEICVNPLSETVSSLCLGQAKTAMGRTDDFPEVFYLELVSIGSRFAANGVERVINNSFTIEMIYNHTTGQWDGPDGTAQQPGCIQNGPTESGYVYITKYTSAYAIYQLGYGYGAMTDYYIKPHIKCADGEVVVYFSDRGNNCAVDGFGQCGHYVALAGQSVAGAADPDAIDVSFDAPGVYKFNPGLGVCAASTTEFIASFRIHE